MNKGRIKLKCVRDGCGKEFSTHSSNREVCHTCKPKCNEIHYFIKKVKEQTAETK